MYLIVLEFLDQTNRLNDINRAMIRLKPRLLKYLLDNVSLCIKIVCLTHQNSIRVAMTVT